MIRMIIALLIVGLAASCGAGSSAPRYEVIYSPDNEPVSRTEPKPSPRTYTMAIVPKAMEIPYFRAANDGAQEAAKDLGVEVIYRGPAIADAGQQIKVIRSLIEQKVHLLAVSANDPERLVPVLQEARQEGIKVITWDSDTRPEARDFFVNMVDPETLGRHLMDTLALSMGEKGEFAIMTGSLSAANLNEWIHWIQVQQKENYPDMKLTEIVPTDDNPRKAYAAAQKLLADHPRLGGIIGNSSIAAPAAAQAVKDSGQSGKIKVVGLSTPLAMRSYLEEGSAQTATLWSPKKLGYLTVALAVNDLNGRFPQNGEEIRNVGKIRVNKDQVIMGEPLDFTRENVNQYDF